MYWAKIQNLKIIAGSLNQLSKYKIKTLDDIDKLLGNKNMELLRNSAEIKEIEWKINELKERIVAIEAYKEYRGVYKRYESAKDKDKYYNSYTSEILLYKSARKKLGQPVTKASLDSIPNIEKEIKDLNKDKEILMKERQGLRENLREVEIIKDNIYKYMDLEAEKRFKGIEH